MIISLGIDLCDIRRVEKLFARRGERFVARYFTTREREYVLRQARPASALARRWAAKEAAAKALGTGVDGGIYLCDIEVIHDANKKPGLIFHGRALEIFARLAPGSARLAAHLSITDEYPYALAQVIISAAA